MIEPIHVIKQPQGTDAQSWNEFIARLVKAGIARPISMSVPHSQDDLDRMVDTDKPVKIMDKS